MPQSYHPGPPARTRFCDIALAILSSLTSEERRTRPHMSSPPTLCRISLNNLVGAGEDRLRNCEAECLSGLQIDRELEMRWPLHRKITRRSAAENAGNIISNAMLQLAVIRPIAEQTA